MKRVLLVLGGLLLLNMVILLIVSHYNAGFLIQGLLSVFLIGYALFYDHFAREILNGRFPHGYSAVLVSSDFHIFRATQTAWSLEMNVKGAGAATSWYALPANVLRETFAVGYMLIFG
ncbi:MAG: YdcF family protein [Oscillospiraceae bacterium]|nr:YdcF family protein [Oscillospiraceae bacterium]